MGLAGRDIASGHLSIGDFVAVNTYLIQLYIPLNVLGFVYREIRQSLIDIEQMFNLMREHKDITDKENAGPLQLGEGSIEFRDVVFGYGKRTILNGVSFFVPAGKKVAIVGESGAGKSTLSRLLFRFYDPQKGSILIDGQDIRDVQQSSVRAAIGVVPQDTVMFNASIGFNIGYGRQGASEEDIREAARLASIDSFIDSLPNGYDERVGERGLKLSGGEKQRVAIARAIVKRPLIFLFDEATSALDTRTELGIQEALNHVSRSSTTIVIAHRLSTIVDADEILVMAKGEIVERGTHEALLKLKGLYSVMWQRQSRKSDTDAPLSPLKEGSEADVA
jgi:ATP-binding cassette subfamily B protein